MSEIKVDTLTGKTTANDITVTVGATATMSLEQGLAKAWVNFNGTGTIATSDSLNISSLTDSGTGIYLSNFSTAMSNANYCLLLSASDAYPNIGNCIAIWTDSGATTTARFGMVNINETTGSYFDSTVVCGSAKGDLA